MPKISNARILIMATDGFEQSELQTPLRKLREAGAEVKVAAPKGSSIRGWNETDWGESVAVDLAISSVRCSDYHCLVLPGGVMNPDHLRMDKSAVALVVSFMNAGAVVAAICHAPWLLVEAGAAEGRELTSFPSIRTDVENAGGFWVDREVVVDGNLVTSRSPADLDAFVAKIIEQIETEELLEGEPFAQNA